jgi:hypothetical protein
MVGELHKRAFQRLRVMPYMSPSGLHWRCSIASVDSFYRNHGAILSENTTALLDDSRTQTGMTIARYSSAQDNHYFDWDDSTKDDARTLADKFETRFSHLAERSKGWDYAYAGWYLHMLRAGPANLNSAISGVSA